jgi:hypothetical protein
MAPALPTALGGALDGISAYAAEDRWHFVTYGRRAEGTLFDVATASTPTWTSPAATVR